MTPPSFALRIFVSALAMATAIGQFAYLDALTWHLITPGLSSGAEARAAVVTAATAHAVLSVASGVLATLIIWRRPPGSVAVRGLAVAIAAWGYLLAYPGIVVLLRPDPGPLRMAFETHFLLIEALGLAALLRFTSSFPTPLTVPTRAAMGAAGWVARGIRPLRVALGHASLVWGSAVMIPALLVALSVATGRPAGDAGLHPVMDVFRVTVATAVVLNLRDSWTIASAADRARMSWLLAGLSALLGSVLLVIGGNILLSATGWPDPPFSWRPILLDLGVLGFVVGLAATELASPGMDSVRSARRIVLGASLIMTTLLAATVLEVLLSSGVFGPVALPAGLGAAMAAAVIGSVSSPLLRFYDRLIAQWPGFTPADQPTV